MSAVCGGMGRRERCVSQCAAGSEPSFDSQTCVDCATGYAGTGGMCEVCAPGKEPDMTRSSCQTCGVGFAGSDGTCEACDDGEQANDVTEPTACVACPTGSAGVGGTCAECSVGSAPNANLTVCDLCTIGRYSSSGEQCEACADSVDGNGVSYGRFTDDLVTCVACPDGTRPSATQSSCEAGPVGTAGQRGTCDPCGNVVEDGATIGKHTPDRIVCEACADAKEPNQLHTGCTACTDGHAGRDGVCDRCTSGQQPSDSSMECLMCNDPNEFDQVNHGWASATGLSCVQCAMGRAPDASNSE